MRFRKGFRLAASCRQAMIAHAVRDLPNECCGVLLGKSDRSARVVPMRNTRPSPDAYFMDPVEQAAVFTEMEQCGESLIGIYHSHPVGPLAPSNTDLQLAFHPEAVYLILSLKNPKRPGIAAFVLERGRLQKTKIEWI